MERRSDYKLEKYHGISSRHQCPACGDRHSFTYYVDDAGCILNEQVGRCNHESGCGYHYTPAQFFADHPERKSRTDWREVRQARPYCTPTKAAAVTIDTIPFEYVQRSASYKSTFIRFLCNLFDIDTLQSVGERYAIGATKAEDVIFWQIDCRGRVRGGKIIKYDANTGHRIKEGAGHVDWVHSRMKKMGALPDSWSLSQCLFGEHLLRWPGTESQPIALVESEKSAIIGAAAYPQYIWMATGGIGNLSPERMEPLKGRTIIIFPDIDGTAKWEEKAKAIRGCKVRVSHILEEHATPEERAAKIDIADWIIRSMLEGSPPQHSEQPPPRQPTEPQRAECVPQWSERGIPHLEHISTPEERQAAATTMENNPAMHRLLESMCMHINGFAHYDTKEEFRAATMALPNGSKVLRWIEEAAAEKEQSPKAAEIVNNNKIE